MTRDYLLLTVVDVDEDKPLAVDRAADLAIALDARVELFACRYDEHIAGTRFFDSPQQSAAREKLIADTKVALEERAAPLRERGIDVTTHACPRGMSSLSSTCSQPPDPSVIATSSRYRHHGVIDSMVPSPGPGPSPDRPPPIAA